MPRCTQSFVNTSDQVRFITLELSTARFRLGPGGELVLHYDTEEVQDRVGACLRIEFLGGAPEEIVVWTGEDRMFLPDGRPAEPNYDLR